jgi:hypothetical protein
VNARHEGKMNAKTVQSEITRNCESIRRMRTGSVGSLTGLSGSEQISHMWASGAGQAHHLLFSAAAAIVVGSGR